MSQITMTVMDGSRSVHGQPHGSFAEVAVAALSAEPETIEELDKACVRFLRPGDESYLLSWRPGECDEPYDAGVCVIDLAARLVVCKSSYCTPGRTGQVGWMRNEPGEDPMVWLPYHLSDDWEFMDDIEGWRAVAEKRRAERAAMPRLDARKVLYDEVAGFIVDECFAARALGSTGMPWTPPEGWEWSALPERANGDEPPSSRDAIAEIHARWLIGPRDDLHGKSPRQVLLEKMGAIDWDLQDREHHWTFLGQPPPCLDLDSAAFRFGGFGTHENVLYYDMVRLMVERCWEEVVEPGSAERADESKAWPADVTKAEAVVRLNALRDEWLNAPVSEMPGGKSASVVIECERARLPYSVSGKDAMIDPDCPLCRMSADGPTPMFWHLDGSSMDEEFPFSFHQTREEWEEEQRRWEEHSRQFNEEWERKKALAEAEGDGEAPASSLWTSSFSAADDDAPPSVRLFGLGGHLAEIVADLKDEPESQAVVDALNRCFDNLTSVVNDGPEALLEPAAERLCQELSNAAEAYPSAAAKCADLEAQVGAFAAMLAGASNDGDSDEDIDLPF